MCHCPTQFHHTSISLWQFVPLFHCSTSLDTITVTMHHCSTVPPYFTTTVTLCHCSTVRPYVTNTVSTITPHYYYSVSTTLASIHFVCFLLFNNCIAKMEVGALSIQRLPLFAASPYIEIMPPWLAQQWNPAMSPHMKGKVEKKQQSLGGGGGGNGWKNPAQRKNWMRQWITWLI